MDVEKLDNLLSKYILVWIWSILFGASSGLIYSLIEYRPERWGILALPLLFVSLLGMFFAFGSFLTLFRYLLNYLLPIFYGRPVPLDEDGFQKSAVILKRAIVYLVAAAVARALMALAEIGLTSVQRF